METVLVSGHGCCCVGCLNNVDIQGVSQLFFCNSGGTGEVTSSEHGNTTLDLLPIIEELWMLKDADR
jgi:hypothetical protein